MEGFLRKSHLQTLLFLLLLLSSLTACHRQQDHLLAQADSLLAAGNADSANALLTRHSEEFAHASRSRRMHYGLLLSDAQNRLFKPFTDDSIMVEVEEYYKDNGTNEQRIRSRYLLGSVYRDMQLPLMAQRWFRKAIDEADTLRQDKSVYLLLAKVYGQLADIYDKQSNHRLSLEANINSSRYARLSGDTLFWAEGLRCAGYSYYGLKQFAQAKKCLYQSVSLHKKMGNEEMAALPYEILAGIYTEEKDFEKAQAAIRIFEQQSGIVMPDSSVTPGQGHETYYAYKGALYYAMGYADSAIAIFKKELSQPTNDNSHIYAYEDMSKVFAHEGKNDSALHYLQKFNELRDSVQGDTSTPFLEAAQKYADIKTLKEQTKAANMNVRYWRSISIIAILFTLVVFYALYSFYKRRAEEKYDNLNKRYKFLKFQIENARENIKSQKEIVGTDNEQVQKLEENLETHNKNLLSFEEKIDAKGLARLRFDEMKRSAVYSHIQALLDMRNNLTQQDWDVITSDIQEKLPDVAAFIDFNRSSMNMVQYHLCLLTCYGLRSVEIAKLIVTSVQNICNSRSILNATLFNRKGSKLFEVNLILSHLD